MPPRVRHPLTDVERVRLFKRDAPAHINAKQLTVEIGDETLAGFDPSFTVRAWNDTSCKVTLTNATHPVRGIAPLKDTLNEQKRVRIVRANLEHSLYAKPLDDNDDKNAFEWEIILKQKPATNVFEYELHADNLTFHYQAALTQEQIDDGATRLDNVVGSYAVYHKTKQWTRWNPDGTVDDYKTGKAFHIYRPEAVDANGKKIWCELFIDADAHVFRVTVPQAFLDSAVYPVIIDPTWGSTAEGATGLSGSLYMRAYRIAGVAGTVTDWHAYTRDAVYQDAYRIALYTDTTPTEPLNLIDTGDVNTISGTSNQWGTGAIDASISSGSNYWAAHIQRIVDGPDIAYDDVAGTDYDSQRTTDGGGWSWDTFPDPAECSGSASERKLSIYFDYTASGGVTVTPDPISFVARTDEPTVIKGSITVTPASISTVMRTDDPTVVKGSVSVTPDPVSVVMSTGDPVVVVGSLSITPDAVSVVMSTGDPTVVVGSISITPDAISCVITTGDPTVVTGSLTITPDAISCVIEVVQPTVVQNVLVTPASVSFASALSVFGSRSPKSSGVQCVRDNLILGKYASGPIDADVAVMYVRAYKWGFDNSILTGVIYTDNADAPQTLVGVSRQTVTVSAANLTTVYRLVFDPKLLTANTFYWIGVQASVEDAGVVLSNTSTRRAIAADTLPINTTFGGTTSSTAAPDVWIEFISVKLGSLSLTPEPLSTVMRTDDPTVVQGSISITPDPISVVMSTNDPTVAVGGIAASAEAASIVMRTDEPTVDEGATTTPDAISIVVRIDGGTVDEGATIATSIVSMVMAVADPTVVIGSITVTPDNLSFVATIDDPTVTMTGGVTITSTTVSFVINLSGVRVNDAQIFDSMRLVDLGVRSGLLDDIAVKIGALDELGVRAGILDDVEAKGN